MDFSPDVEHGGYVGDGAAVISFGSGIENDVAFASGSLESLYVGVQRKGEFTRDSSEAAPRCAQDLEGWEAQSTAFIFDVDGTYIELSGNLV